MNIAIKSDHLAATKALAGRVSVVTGSTSGIGLGIARALAGGWIGRCAQWLWQARSCCAGTSAYQIGLRRRGVIFVGRYVSAVIDLGNDRQHDRHVRSPRYPGQQCRHPIRRAVAKLPSREMGRHPGDQFVVRISHQPPGTAFNACQQMGQDHQLASAHGLVGSPFKAAYVAAKHGIVGLTKVIALETAEHGITCNAICPGYVYTPLVEAQIDDQAKAHGIPREQVIREVLLAQQPNKRFATVEELGALAAFLASDAAASITGTALPVDGGWTAH